MELRTKAGKLTAYAFACGYIERRGNYKLWSEHGVYHVNGIDRDSQGIAQAGDCHWKTTVSLHKARRMLRAMGNGADYAVE